MTDIVTKRELYEFMTGFITVNRSKLFEENILNRTRYITVVLEDLYQPHNASAVLRTCDCLGIQDIHIIENKNEYQLNPDIALGSSKWLTVVRYNEKPSNTADTLLGLKKKGYRIVATSPHPKGITLQELRVEQGPIALVFGTELKGLSPVAIQHADEFMRIPMYGFTESFNISVTVAITLFYLSEKIRNTNIQWQMSEEEKLDTLLQWIRNSVKSSEMIEKKFLDKTGKSI